VRRSLFFGSLAMVLLAALAATLILHPARARSEEKSSSPIEVRVDNFSFAPETLTISVNRTVTWINKDDVPHVIASTDGLFKSQTLDTDDKYSYTFNKVGTYPYYCSVHPKMTGKIIVQ
jgi:plastocyanin